MADDMISVSDSPTVGLANRLMLAMIRHGQRQLYLRNCDDPVCFGGREAPYQNVLNRIKLMAGLNPIGSKTDTNGCFNVTVAGQDYTFIVTVSAGDQRMELTLQ